MRNDLVRRRIFREIYSQEVPVTFGGKRGVFWRYVDSQDFSTMAQACCGGCETDTGGAACDDACLGVVDVRNGMEMWWPRWEDSLCRREELPYSQRL